MHYSSGPRVIPHPPPDVNFLMVEIPTPKPYIFMIRVNRQIKCPKSWGPGSSPHPLPEVFLRILHRKIFPIHHTYIYSLVSYLFIKQDQRILTCNSAVASLMFSRFSLIVFEKYYYYYYFFLYKFDEKRAITPRWVIKFTSKLQGR
jgi:hypothetical protein